MSIIYISCWNEPKNCPHTAHEHEYTTQFIYLFIYYDRKPNRERRQNYFFVSPGLEPCASPGLERRKKHNQGSNVNGPSIVDGPSRAKNKGKTCGRVVLYNSLKARYRRSRNRYISLFHVAFLLLRKQRFLLMGSKSNACLLGLVGSAPSNGLMYSWA